jgi:uncharacterized lipoprotein
MKKTIYAIAIILLSACGNSEQSKQNKKIFSPEEITAESKKANNFFNKV